MGKCVFFLSLFLITRYHEVILRNEPQSELPQDEWLLFLKETA